MPSYAVVCASHGIGLGHEYVRQLASRSDAVVFAIVQDPAASTHLKALASSFKNVDIIAGDVTDCSTLEHSAQQVSEVTGGKLDYFIYDAVEVDVNTDSKGFDDYMNMKKLDSEFPSALALNLRGPMRSITAFLSLLRASDTKKIVVVGLCPADLKSVQTGNIANVCKATAASLGAMQFAFKLEHEGFVVVAFAPGVLDPSATAGADGRAYASSVKDGIEFRVAIHSLEESVAEQLTAMDGLEPSRNGMVLTYLGENDSVCHWANLISRP